MNQSEFGQDLILNHNLKLYTLISEALLTLGAILENKL